MLDKPLTLRQSEVLNIIEDFSAKNGCCPTVREIMSKTGIKSPNGVMCHLKALEKKGKITRISHLSRGISLIPNKTKINCTLNKKIKIGPITITITKENLMDPNELCLLVDSPYKPKHID